MTSGFDLNDRGALLAAALQEYADPYPTDEPGAPTLTATIEDGYTLRLQSGQLTGPTHPVADEMTSSRKAHADGNGTYGHRGQTWGRRV
ncbi:hypothetical protein [Streptomyces nanshensis]|uniref:Uncharacterized protein n=1 Tax=Streptomyces nanshensis TaxID=518642 RepID=A0A1E7L311_9ACTN|nr:hypothetical protein [Streptomyces nanshensis]OEV10560.1 hypothetical protein AN218_17045 [Streptomyces nanshensis]